MTDGGRMNIATMRRSECNDVSNGPPRCSVIVPCRNERKYIARCLDSIIANSYPKDRLEVLVVDGQSEDGTRDIIAKYTRQYHFIRLLVNAKRLIPSAMNRGVSEATGDVIMKMDAHSTYPADYIEKSITYLQNYDADNVGGVCIIGPGTDGRIARAIAHGL